VDDGLGPLQAGQPRAALVGEVMRALHHLDVGATAIVACSGGPDSTALAHLVSEARPDLDLHLVHVRHGLRDDDERDAEVVRVHGTWLDLPVRTLDVEVVAGGQGIEAAARVARYAALRNVAAEYGARTILVGHTAEDQAETVLLRLARGTGLDGLGGMEQVRGDLTRPMLRLRRADVHRFVELEGLPHVEDPSNRDPQVRRAIVRHGILPLLEEVAPDPVAALVRMAGLARDDVVALDAAASQRIGEVRAVGPVRAIPDRIVAVAERDAAGLALARRVVRSVLTDLTGQPPDAATVARVLSLEPGSAASLPGPVEATVAGGWRAFAPRTLPRSSEQPVAVPGRTAWLPAGAVLDAITPATETADDVPDAEDAGDGLRPGGEPEHLTLDLPGIWAPPAPDPRPTLLPPGALPERLVLALPDGLGPLRLRHREPGDEIVTAGGTRSLQDLLVDAGVPRPIRELWPILVAEDGRVLWVPGFAADETILRAGRGSPALQLRLRSAPA
jgi:tRNA(Ile)-lysidine synthase